MARLAIIPARGGSKRIPGKNIRNFHGKPIIAYSIEAARQSGLFDEVIVSTDDDQIRDIAAQYGASVPFLRSAENSNDTATTLDVIREVLAALKHHGKEYQEVCCIYATAPLIRISALEEGLRRLDEVTASVFPVVAFGFPIWRSLKLDADQRVSMNWPEFSQTRSQDLPPAYHDAGQWYWFRPDLLTDSLYAPSSAAIFISEMEAQDIDNESDWKLAEIKYSLLQKVREA